MSKHEMPPFLLRTKLDRIGAARRGLMVLAMLAYQHLSALGGWATDWPVFGGNAERTFVTAESLPIPLGNAWTYVARHAPSPAMYGTHPTPGTVATSTYDLAFYPVIAGGRLYFGSSAEESLVCLNASTGRELWRFFAEGAVRLAPSVADDKVYFGSDDGLAYCIDAASGRLLWKYRAGPGPRQIIGHGRLMSQWPIRTGVAVRDGTAYFAAGMFPEQGVYLCAVDSRTGRQQWVQEIPYPAESYLLATDEHLYLPTGRTAPAVFSRRDGRTLLLPPRFQPPAVKRPGGGGSPRWIDSLLVFGPTEIGLITLCASGLQTDDRQRYAANPAILARQFLADDARIYLLRPVRNRKATDDVKWDLVALGKNEFFRRVQTATKGQDGERAGVDPLTHFLRGEPSWVTKAIESCRLWQVADVPSLSLLVAGDTLLAGGDGAVAGYDVRTGRQQWRAAVEGKAYSLAAAEEALFVSTDRGQITCFRAGVPPTHATAKQDPDDPFASDARQEIRRRAAAKTLEQIDSKKGFCLVLGAGDGRLAAEIARQSQFRILVVDRDPATVQSVRQKLSHAGLYGKRVTVQHLDGRLALPSYFANLIVGFDAGRDFAPDELLDVLRPHGGTLVLWDHQDEVALRQWDRQNVLGLTPIRDGNTISGAVARRGPLPGEGEWTHLYADPANTANSGDRRVVGTEYVTQWFGPPGPERVPDRHYIPAAPLYKNGRMFVLGENYLTAVDAYNGTYLWTKDVPNSTRLFISHDAGPMCVDGRHVYVASGSECWVLDAANGEKAAALKGPSSNLHWGYVASEGELLLGSNQNPAASMNQLDHGGGLRRTAERHEPLYEYRSGRSRPVVSDSLFALDKSNFQLAWVYTKGKMLNSSITIGGGRVFFAESRNKKAMTTQTGRVDLEDFLADGAYLVALDLRTGKSIWQQPLDMHGRFILYLAYAEGALLGTNTYIKDPPTSPPMAIYEVRAWDPATGVQKWQTVFDKNVRVAPNVTDHNGYLQHAAIVDGRMYFNPWVSTVPICEIATGADQSDLTFGGSRRCMPFAASSRCLFFREESCKVYDVTARQKAAVTAVSRPSCWISMIPAGGLLLMPEGSQGCVCGYPLQTTIVLRPKSGVAKLGSLSSQERPMAIEVPKD